MHSVWSIEGKGRVVEVSYINLHTRDSMFCGTVDTSEKVSIDGMLAFMVSEGGGHPAVIIQEGQFYGFLEKEVSDDAPQTQPPCIPGVSFELRA